MSEIENLRAEDARLREHESKLPDPRTPHAIAITTRRAEIFERLAELTTPPEAEAPTAEAVLKDVRRRNALAAARDALRARLMTMAHGSPEGDESGR